VGASLFGLFVGVLRWWREGGREGRKSEGGRSRAAFCVCDNVHVCVCGFEM